MRLTLTEVDPDANEYAQDEHGRIFVKEAGSDTWRYLIVSDLIEDERGVRWNLTTAPIRSLTTAPA